MSMFSNKYVYQLQFTSGSVKDEAFIALAWGDSARVGYLSRMTLPRRFRRVFYV